MSSRTKRQRGPVETLCEEIDFRFHPDMERPDVLVAFVRHLVGVIEDMREMDSLLSGKIQSKAPSEASAQVLVAAARMLTRGATVDEMIAGAAEVRALARELNPECAYPTDHLIDMLSGCASAIRFGLEVPCRSRHAAAAANDIWGQRYGINLFDRYTTAWRNDWARDQLQQAILSEMATNREALARMR